ncbi:helix-turn-helix transcriptional regulator [uncultured Algibacter sp.]|uniref:helix-turn-helix domain-containing protein n=1 Tax=uncultured Algibacter sp. TaxID=298659 RepID=UPI0032178A17
MEHVLEKIKLTRKERGYSHEFMAHELNISQVAYSKLEKNNTKLTVERLFKIAEILDVEIGELLDIRHTNQFNQTNKESATAYLQQTANFYQENKEQNQKIIQLYEARLQDKEKIINRLEGLIN